MRLFWKFLLLVLAAALAGPFFIKGPDGDPLLTGSDIKQSFQKAASSAKRKFRSVSTDTQRALGNDDAGKTTVHKWQDANGQWHYSDEAPEGAESETLVVDPDVNVMDAVPVNKTGQTIDNTPAETDSTEISQPLIPLPTPGRVKESLQKTRDAKQQVEDRNQAQKEALDDI